MLSIYPEGHKGGYDLKLKENPAYMLTGSFSCPLCGVSFKAFKVRDVKLIPLKVGELRTKYKDFEPMYYEITSCPNCRYSAQTPLYDKLSTPRKRLIKEALAPYIPYLPEFSETLTPDRVFERYYLALMCYGVGFGDKELLEAGLWLKLCNLYADAEDADMEAYAAGEAQKSYLAAFQKLRISPMKFPSLNLRIGMLSIRVGDNKTARDFLYKVKIDANSTRLQKDTADDALNDLKALEGS
jgi:uncharacterized protein (DUF2225 family)